MQHRFTAAVCAAAALLGAAASEDVLANVFAVSGKDPRQSYDWSSPKVRMLPVGLVYNRRPVRIGVDAVGDHIKKIGRGSGFMISPCYAVTNHHVVFGLDDAPTKGTDYPMIFSILGGKDDERALSVAATPVKVADIAKHPGQDWAILKLESCLGEKIGWFSLDETDDPEKWIGAPVNMAGFPGERDEKTVTIQYACKIVTFDLMLGFYKHDCATTAGQSGGPIYLSTKPVPTVVAINTGDLREAKHLLDRYDERHANLATTMKFLTFYPDIARGIKRDIARFGKPNPLQRFDVAAER